MVPNYILHPNTSTLIGPQRRRPAMPGSYFELYIHLIWTVKNREHLLTPDIEKPIIDIIKRKAASQKATYISWYQFTLILSFQKC